MTIKPGEAWGRRVPRPEPLTIARDDATVVAALARSAGDGGAVAVGGGDLARTLGNPSLDGRGELNQLTIDLVEVRTGHGAPRSACAHVTVRPPWRRGGWLRGPAIVVMNAQFLGHHDVAPRGHPNDGRVEVFEIAPSMSVRDRLVARRRARHAGHVPHPSITVRSVRRAEWTFAAPMALRVDGRRLGTVRLLAVSVEPDAAIVYA